MRRPASSLAIAVVAALSAVVPAMAQTTRAEEIAAAQAEKAAAMPVDRPGWLERTVVDFRRRAIESPSGPYPSIDSIYQGGGATGGAGYRQVRRRPDVPERARPLLGQELLGDRERPNLARPSPRHRRVPPRCRPDGRAGGRVCGCRGRQRRRRPRQLSPASVHLRRPGRGPPAPAIRARRRGGRRAARAGQRQGIGAVNRGVRTGRTRRLASGSRRTTRTRR